MERKRERETHTHTHILSLSISLLHTHTLTYTHTHTHTPGPRERQTLRFIEAGCCVSALEVVHTAPSPLQLSAAVEAADVIVVSVATLCNSLLHTATHMQYSAEPTPTDRSG